MKSLNQTFTIHPVGQGFFYSGLIKFNNEVKFRMVFDCGSNGSSTQAGIDEVNIYRDEDFIRSKVLDLLIVSHFHQDHINHIESLLDGGIKVKKLVMPFITFTERLFLLTKYLSDNNGYNSDDNFFVSFLIDPLGTINDNLDDDSEIFLIEGGPDNPKPTEDNLDNDSINPEKETKRFTFDFDKNAKIEVDGKALVSSPPVGKMYRIKHSEKGKIQSGKLLFLMEFLFYRRKISKNDEEFFREVEKLFLQVFSINKNLDDKELIEKLTDTIKGIKSAKKIEGIFKKVKKKFGFKSKTGELKIEDMNTTALCMLHKNLFDILALSGISRKLWKDVFYEWPVYKFLPVYSIQKFFTNSSQRIEIPYFDDLHYHWYPRKLMKNKFIFPNVLLTSDSFLLTENQVNDFAKHYANHWQDFWLFQISHHGSKNSCGNLLLSLIPRYVRLFINYGVMSKKHPSSEVIQNIVASGHSCGLIANNEYQGLRVILDI